jgi:hypothetical protein
LLFGHDPRAPYTPEIQIWRANTVLESNRQYIITMFQQLGPLITFRSRLFPFILSNWNLTNGIDYFF